MPLPAFSNISLSNYNARLLWSCYFDGSISFATPTTPGVTYNYLGDITGVDSNGHGVTTANTAFGMTGATPDFYAQYIMDDIGVVHPLADIWTQTIRASTFPGGIGNEIEITQVARNETEWVGSRPQGLINMALKNSTEAINEFYCSKFVEIPSNLANILDKPSGVSWLVLADVKCGDSNTNDCRLTIDAVKLDGETGFRFRTQLDNCGTNVLTGITDNIIAGLDIIYPGGVPTVDAIDYTDTDEGSVVAGKQYKIEYWIKRPPDRTDLTTGRLVGIATRMDTGERITLINKTGGQFWGYHSHHFQRFFHALVYTGGFPNGSSVSVKFSNIEYWDKPPYILI